MPWRALRLAAVVVFGTAPVNVLLLVVFGSYDLRVGPLHLGARFLFKPLLYLNAAFLVALLARRGEAGMGAPSDPRYGPWPSHS